MPQGAYTKQCGQPAYHPVMMARLLMYAYARGITSSREIERRCETDIAFRYLTGGEQPDHDTVCTFGVRHQEAFRALFVDTLRLARQLEAEKKLALAVDKARRRQKIGKAKEELEQEAREKAEAKGEDKPEEAKPSEKAQRNFTDPDSRIMPRAGTFQQSYTAQVAVDADTQLIVAQEVGQSGNDARQLEPMVEQVRGNTGLVPVQLSADSGYLWPVKLSGMKRQLPSPPRRGWRFSTWAD